MEIVVQSFNYESYNDISELPVADARLLREAQEATARAYAPYSHFRVGAVIRLTNGAIVAGANQENASFPLGLCAERVALAAAASLYPQVPIELIAISYQNLMGESNHPVSPCGICRQVLSEYEQALQHPIRLILGGMSGKVYIVSQASALLPLSFSAESMK